MADHGTSLTLGEIIFNRSERGAELALFCGLSGAGSHHGAPFRTLGPAYLRTSRGRFEADDFMLTHHASADSHLVFHWRLEQADLAYESSWQRDSATGIVQRNDTLVNTGVAPVIVSACLARFGYAPAVYEAYCQSGRWVHENQGAWVPLHTGALVLGATGGRTTQGSTPFVCIREKDGAAGIAFHVLPRGNWTIRLSLHPLMNSGTGGLSVEIGPASDGLALTLAPGARWPLPTILICPLAGGNPEDGCAPLHRYVNRSLYADYPVAPPIAYNTWFDRFDRLETPRLQLQLAAAVELGVEVFTVDAGWFGTGTNWFSCTGDWHESDTAAFHGAMSSFVAAVRAAGLKFGLWMEPERGGANASVRAEHPDYFVGGRTASRYDLERPEVYAYLKGQIQHVLDTYALDWLKVDFNAELGDDERGSQLHGYYDAWYRMLDELRAAYPATFFEGCSSGGMRCELEALRHHDDLFLSDTCNAFDVVRIAEGARLRLPPGRIGMWTVLQARGERAQHSSAFAAANREQILTASPAETQPLLDGEIVSVDFAVLASLPGTFGLSGDLHSLGPDTRARLAFWIAFYKTWRGFIAASHAYPLTPVRPMTDRRGWAALQLCNPADPRSLVFVYRLYDSRSAVRLKLRELDTTMSYRVTDAGSGVTYDVAGATLTAQGLAAMLATPVSAAVYVIEPSAARDTR